MSYGMLIIQITGDYKHRLIGEPTMNYSFQKVLTPQKDLPKHEGIEFETLESYIEQAKRLITYYCNKRRSRAQHLLQSSDDAISLVAHALMMADWTYDSSKDSGNGKCSKNTYRFLSASWAIKSFVTKTYANSDKVPLSLDTPIGSMTNNGSNDRTLMNLIEDQKYEQPASKIERDELRESIEQLLGCGIVSTTQAQYLRMRYLEEMSLDAIAEARGVTRQAVYDGIKRATRFIRKGLGIA